MAKKTILLLLAAAVMLSGFSLVFADGGTFTNANNPVAVSRTMSGYYKVTVSSDYFANTAVTLAAIENGSAVTVIKTDPTKVIYASEKKADENGNVSFSFVSTSQDFYIAVSSVKPVSYTENGTTTPYIKVTPAAATTVDLRPELFASDDVAETIPVVVFGQIVKGMTDCDIVEYGVVFANTNTAISFENAKKYKGLSPYRADGTFAIGFNNFSLLSGLYTKAYIVYEDGEGERFTVFSNDSSQIQLTAGGNE